MPVARYIHVGKVNFVRKAIIGHDIVCYRCISVYVPVNVYGCYTCFASTTA